MSDIQAGDVVVCVDVSTHVCESMVHVGERFSLRRTYRVSRLQRHHCGCAEAILADGSPGLLIRFRKIRPADEGFSAWMKTCRPKSRERTDA